MSNFLKEYKVILWDFDGVILNSMAVRDQGFVDVLQEFPKVQIEALLAYHRKNGGLSRYVKFRYFFEDIRNEKITDKEIQVWAEKFSVIMKSLLTNPQLLINDSLHFIKANAKYVKMHVVSGSDQSELRFLCDQLGIATYFKTIHGSPTPKKQLVKELLKTNGYNHSDCILIGDSYNDFEAAEDNNISFAGYNNEALRHLGVKYIQQF